MADRKYNFKPGFFLSYTWPFLALLVLFLLVHYLFPKSDGGVAVSSLPDTKKIAIDTVIEVNKFMISIAYIILGFFGSILIGKVFMKRTKIGDTFLFGGCVFSLIAIYLGYQLYETLILHLNNRLADVEETSILWLRKIQFYFTLCAAVSFIIYVFKNSVNHANTSASPEQTTEKVLD